MDPTYIRRDQNSSAIINTDSNALTAYKLKRANAKKMKELETDINSVKQELKEIKHLLQQIITNRG